MSRRKKQRGDESCLCSKCEVERFAGWLEAMRALHSVDPRKPEWINFSDRSPRMQLVWEMHASVCQRYPLGIAEILYGVITSLHIGDDLDAITDMRDLLDAEQESRNLDEEVRREPCLKVRP